MTGPRPSRGCGGLLLDERFDRALPHLIVTGCHLLDFHAPVHADPTTAKLIDGLIRLAAGPERGVTHLIRQEDDVMGETRSDQAGPEDAAFDRKGQDAIEGRKPADRDGHPDAPPAGPHATERLTSDIATPGSGALPSGGDQTGEVDPATE